MAKKYNASKIVVANKMQLENKKAIAKKMLLKLEQIQIKAEAFNYLLTN